MKTPLLIVEDDEEIQSQMKWALTSHYDVHLANDRRSAHEQFCSVRPAVVLLDLGLPPHPKSPAEGLAALSDLLSTDGRAKIIVVSGQGEKETALRAIGAGAYDFLTKPVDTNELKLLVKRCVYVAQLEREYKAMESRLQGGVFEGLLGTSPAIQTVFDAIRKVATTDAPVLVLGESGTGKEMTARAIHQRGSRREGPFVAINCSAIPESLMESELFGHEKGAFTGAHQQRKGRIESAAGGTLFLDEIGEISPLLQVKLLRFLQDRRIERVGGRQEISVDTRVIAATNADLTKSMAEGKFREDLYYRLAVVQIILPPLRDRAEDIVFLAQHFVQQFANESDKTEISFTADALHAIRTHRWPGNVRELQNRVRRAVIMSANNRISPADLEIADSAGSASLSLKQARDTLDREMIQRALSRCGKIASAAIELGISRPTLYELMEKLDIKRPDVQ